ncbi:MAG: response regulator [Nitrospirota bacterium]
MPILAKKILIVDDDIAVRNLLNEILTFHGYDVDCVSNGEDAIKLIKAKHYDVLVTDYMMPGINGIELVKKARDIKSSMPIIGMSGSYNEKNFLAAGANLFIAKPFVFKKLKDILEKELLILNS